MIKKLPTPRNSPCPIPHSQFPIPYVIMHALSIPTWIIHVSSVIEWIAAIWLIWTYGELTNNRTWWALSLAMLPALVSAMCACTWHYFDNAESLEWLVTLQATMTLVGNLTMLAAAVWIWRSTQPVKIANNSVAAQSIKSER
jgi:hypothetical protein